MKRKAVREIEAGDQITIPSYGRRVLVTDARKHRRYAGYYAIQFRDEDRVVQIDLLGIDMIEVHQEHS